MPNFERYIDLPYKHKGEKIQEEIPREAGKDKLESKVEELKEIKRQKSGEMSVDAKERKIYMDEAKVNSVDYLDEDGISKAVRSGVVATNGKLVGEFEKRISEFLRIPEAVAVNSGTSALHLALLACGVGRGDEVIVPDLTFIATANAVAYTGAVPVIVPVNSKTWCLDKRCLRHITTRTKAIIGVSLFGNPCDWARIIPPARRRGIAVIEDASQAFGTRYEGKYFTKGLSYQCFSFNGNKTITTGSGGLVVGPNLDHVRYLADIARERGLPQGLGYNYNMTNLSAGLGISQLKRAWKFFAAKRVISDIYLDKLGRDLVFQEAQEDSAPLWWMNAVYLPWEVPGIDRIFKEVPTKRMYRPFSKQSAPYLMSLGMSKAKAWSVKERGENQGGLFNTSRKLFLRGFCLPSSVRNRESDIFFVCDEIKRRLKHKHANK